MVHTLDRLGFTYKKTTIVPGKANPEKQKRIYRKLQTTQRRESPWRYSQTNKVFEKFTHPPSPSFFRGR
ncbi:hypothetical protein [Candidatus Kuenenia sp.]|uniref:hypothetical protein n=1 Tax=Candidatus Kuenenia sp. TaxID=2499824 RepID=UPI003AF4D2F8